MAKPFSRNPKADARLTLIALEGPPGVVENNHVTAHYNPKEIQIDKTMKWDTFRIANAGEAYLTFGGAEGRTLTMELLFDCFEDGAAGATLEADLDKLTEMSLVLEDTGDPHLIRPPILEISNGPIPGYRCVLESLSIKVLMFGKLGVPLRATANCKFKEARLTGNGMLGAAARSSALTSYTATKTGMKVKTTR